MISLLCLSLIYIYTYIYMGVIVDENFLLKISRIQIMTRLCIMTTRIFNKDDMLQLKKMQLPKSSTCS